MGSVNYGNQIQTVRYYSPADSDDMNRRNVDIEACGVYRGGLLTKVNDTTVTLSALVAEITDSLYQIKVETQSIVTVTVGIATPYVVLRWAYVASPTNSYMDVLAVAVGSLQANDLIIGKCEFAGPVLTGFAYTARTLTMRFKEFLKVVPTEPASMKVHVKAGWFSNGSARKAVPEQDSPFTIVAPVVNPRVDYVYLTDAGVVSVETGVEAVSPVAKDYMARRVLAEVALTVGQTTIVESDITLVSAGGVAAGGGSGGSVIGITQALHGLAVGESVRWDSGTSKYVKAQADSAANARVIGMVSTVVSPNDFEMTLIGPVTGLAGLASGSLYYLSPSVAGGLTVTPPTVSGQESKPLFIATSATAGYFFNWRGLTLPFGGAGVTKDIAQGAHGLVVGNLVRMSGVNYVKAQADSVANAEVVAIVSAVADPGNFTITFVGDVTGLAGLVAGTVYYLDASVAGGLTSVEPVGQGDISKPLFIAYSTTAGFFFNFRGRLQGYLNYMTTFVNGDLAAGKIQFSHNFNQGYVVPVLWDNNGNVVVPDEFTRIDANTLEVDVSSYVPITGTYTIAILAIGGDTNIIGNKIQNGAAVTSVETKADNTIEEKNNSVLTRHMTAVGIQSLAKQSRARAYLSGAYSMGSGAWEKVELDVESFDEQGEFDPVTNHRFVATVAGIYHVSGTVYFTDSAAGTVRIAGIYKNGSPYSVGATDDPRAASASICPVVDIVELAVGEYVELWGYHNVGIAHDVLSGAEKTHLSVHKLS